MERLLRADEIEVKIKQVSKNGAVALLYKTARTDMTVLDEVYGAEKWTVDYKEIKGNLYCGIGIYTENTGLVWKWDCGIESREDGEGNQKKGEASDAFKRAGFKWGIGRELYTAPFMFLSVPTEEDDNKKAKVVYKLKDRYQTFYVSKIEYEGNTIKSVEIKDNKGTVVYPSYKKPQAETPKKPDKTPDKQPENDYQSQLKDLMDNSKGKITGTMIAETMERKFSKRKASELNEDQFIALLEELTNEI